MAKGASIDLCPPGGAATQEALARLLGEQSHQPLPAPVPLLAHIREEECIGCTLCIKACPVDAIVGAPQLMHTVLDAECTGCELCVAPCPVDCIDMVPAEEEGLQTWHWEIPDPVARRVEIIATDAPRDEAA